MIEMGNLSKLYGRMTAVAVPTVMGQPGRVTGFLGPNGAGEPTTMRAVVGLDWPTGGEVLSPAGATPSIPRLRPATAQGWHRLRPHAAPYNPPSGARSG